MFQILYLTFTAITFALSLLDTYFYQGFCQNYFKISADLFLIIYLVTSLSLSILNINLYHNWFKKINNRFLFPLLFLIYSVILYFEKNNYPNFVFSNFHIHRLIFLNLVVITGSIFYLTYPNFKKKFNRIVYSLLPFLIIFSYYLYLFNIGRYYPLIREDGILEYLQFILYFISFLYSLKIFLYYLKQSKRKIHALFFFFLTFGLLFIAGEEISWGQRIFQIETPSKLAAINAQGEITLHNIKYFQKNYLHLVYIGIAVYGLLSNFILKKFFSKIYQKYQQLTFPCYLFFCFFVLFIYYVLFDYFQFLYILTPEARANIFLSEEIAETYLAMAMIIFTYRSFKNTKSDTTYI